MLVRSNQMTPHLGRVLYTRKVPEKWIFSQELPIYETDCMLSDPLNRDFFLIRVSIDIYPNKLYSRPHSLPLWNTPHFIITISKTTLEIE